MNLAEMRARTRQDLEDTDSANYRWVDDEVDAAIERVVREFSLASPIDEQNDIATTDGSRQIDISALTKLLKVDSVEFPLDNIPPHYQHFEVWGSVVYMQQKGDGDDARIRLHKQHTLLGVTPWAASTAYALATIVIPTANNGLWYECTTAGTSAASEPTWPTTPGQTVTDGTTLVWTCRKSTIPQQFEEIIVLGATGYLATSASVYTVDKASTGGPATTTNYLKWGQTRLEYYHARLKAIAVTNRILPRELYTDD